MNTWSTIREYFIGVCKDKPVDPEEFQPYLSELERFLLDRLVPRTFDNQAAIDLILEEAGDVTEA